MIPCQVQGAWAFFAEKGRVPFPTDRGRRALEGGIVHPSVLAFLMAGAVRAENAAAPLGEPVLEASTTTCLGVYWIIGGDENRNAQIETAYRPAGQPAWQPGPPLFRVERGANRLGPRESQVKVPPDAWLFAGSLFGLAPDAAYEVRLRLTDPDGGRLEQVLARRTAAEPTAPATMEVRHVVPGQGGGSGTVADPFRGLDAAQDSARPGNLFLLHAGIYVGPFTVARRGRPDAPIIWRAAGDGDVILDAQGAAPNPPERAISASEVHDVWFEGLTIRNARWGLVAHESARIIVRRCRFAGVKNGLTATRNAGQLAGFFISDNVLDGPFTWDRRVHGASVEESRGIELSGVGHEVCYNRVRGFKDGIDTYPGPRCEAIDIHRNDISDCLDDGCELDGSERNVRCFLNRFTNVFQGISVQPIYGGPAYVVRNALYNVEVEPFKMHNGPSGGLFIHNTVVKKGMPFTVQTTAKVRNCLSRNNLFIGTEASFACEITAPMEACDFDYDGFGGGPWRQFLKWNGRRYATLAEVQAQAPVYRRALVVDARTVFAGGVRPPADERTAYNTAVNDLRLSASTAAIDAGQALPGFNDDFRGRAPDLGACEFGSALPHYGPR
jgi:hypothetical protein